VGINGYPDKRKSEFVQNVNQLYGIKKRMQRKVDKMLELIIVVFMLFGHGGRIDQPVKQAGASSLSPSRAIPPNNKYERAGHR